MLGKPLKTLMFGILLTLAGTTLQAQPAGKYIISANLYLSVGDWTAIWLNGNQLVDQYPYTSVTRGYLTVKLNGDQICFFQKENIMAMEMTETVEDHTIQNEKDKVGIAYVLEMNYSDGGKEILSSSDEGQHKYFKTDDQPDSNPSGWKNMGYGDSFWEQAPLVGPSSEISKVLQHPATHKTVQYLWAFDVVNLKSHSKERRLFRRKFPLSIVPAPPCPQPKVIPTETPKPRPTATPTWTFTPRPWPTATPTFTRTPRPRPTSTDTPVPIVRKPRATPTVIRRVKKTVRPTFTPVPYIPQETPTPTRRKAWPTPTLIPRVRPTATSTEIPEMVESLPQTIVFVVPPVNILVNFADGPGKYKLEIVDNLGNHLRTLFDKRVLGAKEAWLSWDGNNDEGRLMRYGHYSAVFSKDEKVLRHIALEWIPPDH